VQPPPEVLEMSALSDPMAKRLATLIQLLGSNFEGEAFNAFQAIRRQLMANKSMGSDIAALIENHQAELEGKKYSDADAEIIFERGKQKGREEEAHKQQAPPEFYDADGEPRWYEIAVFCQQNNARLSEWERNFVSDMPSRMLRYRKPKGRQVSHLLGIFVKLGGYYDPKTAHLRF
jgi:hypothetical protein